MLLILKSSFKESVAKSHHWTPMKMETMEQSNLGSLPHQPTDGAADQGPWPTVLEEARATSPCTAEGPPSRWPGTSLREKWAHWLGILEDLQGIGQGRFEKDLRKFWKNPPPNLFLHKMHTEGNGCYIISIVEFLLKTLKYSQCVQKSYWFTVHVRF